jgi:hypothetical protein
LRQLITTYRQWKYPKEERDDETGKTVVAVKTETHMSVNGATITFEKWKYFIGKGI